MSEDFFLYFFTFMFLLFIWRLNGPRLNYDCVCFKWMAKKNFRLHCTCIAYLERRAQCQVLIKLGNKLSKCCINIHALIQIGINEIVIFCDIGYV